MEKSENRKRRGPYMKHVFSGDVPKTSKWRITLQTDQSNEQMEPTDKQQQHDASESDNQHGDDSNMYGVESGEELIDLVDIVNDSEEDFSFDEEDVDKSYDDKRRDDTTEKDELLYSGSRISLGVSMLLIITFVMKHGLSGAGLTDLLTMLEIHCPTPNICKQSWQIFREFFLKLKSPLQFHYYCNFCSSYIGLEKIENCSNCSNEDVTYFLVIPIIEQIQSLLARPGLGQLLSDAKTRLTRNTDMEDVMDGKLYKECFPDGYFNGTPFHRKEKEMHFSFQLNTDGVALFKSSKFSVWPVYLVINELPPKERFLRENRLFAGLWFGKNKPNMNAFLTPLVEEINYLYNKGLTVTLGGKLTLFRAILLSIVCDAPARCMVQKFTQFNGFYGCPSCLSKGESVKTSERGTTLVYPYDTHEENITTGHAKYRTHSECLGHARIAETEEKTHMGVKGYSVLYRLPLFDIVRGVTVDYMHCVLLGVMKMLVHLWIDVKHKGENFFIGSYIDVLNERILSIQPPRTITRAPRSVKDVLHWKASEYRSFLLFYSVICLSGILPDEYLQHFMLFLGGIYTLLQSRITEHDLVSARVKLAKFCAQFDYLYDTRYESSNLHSLLHLCKKVEDLGPLWCHSCFFYEDLNGDLRGLFHGTQAVQMQITLAVSIQQQIPILANTIVPGSAAERLFNKMRKRFVQNNRHEICIDEKIYAVGITKWCKLSTNLANKIKKKFGEILTCEQFFRLLSHGTMYHSKQYKCVSRRNSYTVQYSKNSKIYFGSIEYYLKCLFSDNIKYFAVVKKLLVQKNSCIANLNNEAVQHLVPVKIESASTPILVEDIKQPCVFLNVKGVNQTFIALFPNFVEKE